jgi:DNA polymerase-1
MIELESRLRDTGLPAHILLQVHDELVLEVDETQLAEVAPVVTSTMEGAFTLDVPVLADMRTGPNWEDMTAYTLD